ncbi:MAG: DUF2652 domain-containing protein, partial [Chloroflexota bacterium]
FLISGFRGDAIFMYVPETNICAAQTLLESLENLYFVFADTLRQMIFNTTCTCRACKNMSKLDLKMVIHYGEYAIQKLGDREELLGADVIVPHRMLKNHVIEQTAIESYALFSEAAAEVLELSELAYPLIPHVETYPHIGEVKMQVLDLRKVWENEQERKRVVITPEGAWITLGYDTPYPAVVVWEYLTNRNLEKIYLEYDFVERTDALGGRTQPDTTYHCAHGEIHYFNTILDWKPFEYLTIRQKVSIGLETIQTRRVEPTENGSRLMFLLDKPETNATEETRQLLINFINDAGGKFMKQLESDIANGSVTVAASS